MDKANSQSRKWEEIIEPVQFDFNGALTKSGFDKISKGFIPQESDDRWFAFVTDEFVLRFIRSWTGKTAFLVKFYPDGENYKCQEAFISKELWDCWGNNEERASKELIDCITFVFNVKLSLLESE